MHIEQTLSMDFKKVICVVVTNIRPCKQRLSGQQNR